MRKLLDNNVKQIRFWKLEMTHIDEHSCQDLTIVNWSCASMYVTGNRFAAQLFKSF